MTDYINYFNYILIYQPTTIFFFLNKIKASWEMRSDLTRHTLLVEGCRWQHWGKQERSPGRVILFSKSVFLPLCVREKLILFTRLQLGPYSHNKKTNSCALDCSTFSVTICDILSRTAQGSPFSPHDDSNNSLCVHRWNCVTHWDLVVAELRWYPLFLTTSGCFFFPTERKAFC